VRVARYAIGVLAAAGFAGGVAVVRAAHPGSHGHAKAVPVASLAPPQSFRAAEAESQSSVGVGGGSSISPAPPVQQPVVQSSGS
jgi:hypothetical protein